MSKNQVSQGSISSNPSYVIYDSAREQPEIPESVQEAYDKATGEWSGADWNHEYDPEDSENDGSEDDSEDDEDYVPGQKYCDGDRPGCKTCQAAERDAAAAEEYAQEALTAIETGDWDMAVERAESAARTEREWGDDPVWGPFAEAVKYAARFEPLSREELIQKIEDLENASNTARAEASKRRHKADMADIDNAEAARIIDAAMGGSSSHGGVNIHHFQSELNPFLKKAFDSVVGRHYALAEEIRGLIREMSAERPLCFGSRGIHPQVSCVSRDLSSVFLYHVDGISMPWDGWWSVGSLRAAIAARNPEAVPKMTTEEKAEKGVWR